MIDSEEESFQKRIEENPDDDTTRLVFADWLQERDDPRAEGYRVMVFRKMCADWDEDMYPGANSVNGPPGCWQWWRYEARGDDIPPGSRVPAKWLRQLRGGFPFGKKPSSVDYLTRREADDALAEAFSRLTEAERDEILNQKGVAT